MVSRAKIRRIIHICPIFIPHNAQSVYRMCIFYLKICTDWRNVLPLRPILSKPNNYFKVKR